MKFSLWPHNERTPADLLEEARAAEETGWYGVWLADHYMPNTGDTTPARGDAYECWALLPALAAVTERVRIGTLVSPTSVHHPALLAKRTATIDHLSRGRMVLGLGAGWQINEHHAYGIELEPPGKRVSRFEEAIQIVRAMLSEESTTFHGACYEITDAPCDPKPVQSPLPLLVGTRSPRMLRITARYANEWNTWGTPETMRRKLQILDEHCITEGRDPREVKRAAQAVFFLDGDSERIEAARNARRFPVIAGNADELKQVVAEYRDAGLDELVVPTLGLGRGDDLKRTIKRFITEVAADFR
ncbi:MAG TPA: LLM class flavin-dependent oxidoreductase [Bryobacteraceae bacterium]|nr:LLM class flavin-dependent oxidoreductase [Bryobacteraceae bacterium]